MTNSRDRQTWLATCLTILALSHDASATCVAKDVTTVKKGATNYVDFCSFYNARSAPKATTSAVVLPTPSATKGKCFAYDMALVKADFPDAKGFCKFYDAFSNTLPQTPIPGMSSARLVAACSCIIENVVVVVPSTTSTKMSSIRSMSSTSNAHTTSTTRSTSSSRVTSSHTSSTGKATTPSKPASTSKSTTTSLHSGTTTTTSVPFCSAAPVTSLVHDPSRITFCQYMLQIPTVTHTSVVTSVPPIDFETVTSTVNTVVTQVDYEPSLLYSEVEPVSTITAYASYCGNGNGPSDYLTKKRGIDIRMPIPTPPYLSGRPRDYLTSACGCVSDLPTPSAVTVSTFVPQPSTIMTQVMKVVTSEVDVTAYSGVSVVVSTGTKTSYTTAKTSTLPNGQATSFANNEFAFWYGTQLSTDVIGTGQMGMYNPIVVSACYCPSEGETCYGHNSAQAPVNQGSCKDAASCVTICDNWSKTSGILGVCNGMMWDPDKKMCYILDATYNILMNTTSCGIADSNNASFVGSWIKAVST
ncbi:hypothetical protein K461DRAFT_314549 [Myriangium duriaei CBS 260.36]|uniref:Apple domain-containing protein n=1 Tax=Myriangium duriaei CBS 260.36 TaxID=1168546 RepID=A0A9P4IZA4_9PEZI|nr:hypothetical protein K461DRAFT_314549 [Myriangium duriaei CBS 260.36]